MPTQSRSASEPQSQDHYVYRVNALIEEGDDDLAREVVTEASLDLANTTGPPEPAGTAKHVINRRRLADTVPVRVLL
jgi:hypothetical protein